MPSARCRIVTRISAAVEFLNTRNKYAHVVPCTRELDASILFLPFFGWLSAEAGLTTVLAKVKTDEKGRKWHWRRNWWLVH